MESRPTSSSQTRVNSDGAGAEPDSEPEADQDSGSQADEREYVTSALCTSRGCELILDLTKVPGGDFVHKELRGYFETALPLLRTNPNLKVQKLADKLKQAGIPDGFNSLLAKFERRPFAKIPRGSNKTAVFRCLSENHLTICAINQRLGKAKFGTCSGCVNGGTGTNLIGKRYQPKEFLSNELFANRDIDIVLQIWPLPEGTFVDPEIPKHLELVHRIVLAKNGAYSRPKSTVFEKQLHDEGVPKDLAKKFSKFETKKLEAVEVGTGNFALFRCKREGHITLAKIGDKVKRGGGCGGCSNVSDVIARGKVGRENTEMLSAEALAERGLEIILDLNADLKTGDFYDSEVVKYWPLTKSIINEYSAPPRRVAELVKRGVPKDYAEKLGQYETRAMQDVPAGTDRYAFFRCFDKQHITLSKIYDKARKKSGCGACYGRHGAKATARQPEQAKVPRAPKQSSEEPILIDSDSDEEGSEGPVLTPSKRTAFHLQSSNEDNSEPRASAAEPAAKRAKGKHRDPEMDRIGPNMEDAAGGMDESWDVDDLDKGHGNDDLGLDTDGAEEVAVFADDDDDEDDDSDDGELDMLNQILHRVSDLKNRIGTLEEDLATVHEPVLPLAPEGVSDSPSSSADTAVILASSRPPGSQQTTTVVRRNGNPATSAENVAGGSDFVSVSAPQPIDRTPMTLAGIIKLVKDEMPRVGKWFWNSAGDRLERRCYPMFRKILQPLAELKQLEFILEAGFKEPGIDGKPTKEVLRMDLVVLTMDRTAFCGLELKKHDTQSHKTPSKTTRNYADRFVTRIQCMAKFGFSETVNTGKRYYMSSENERHKHIPSIPGPDGRIVPFKEMHGMFYSLPTEADLKVWHKELVINPATTEVLSSTTNW